MPLAAPRPTITADYMAFIKGTDDPTPDLTASHITHGRNYLGFQLTGIFPIGRSRHLRFDHPSGMRLMVTDISTVADPDLHIRMIETFILEDIRRLMN